MKGNQVKSEKELLKDLDIAAVNSKNSFVVAGSDQQIEDTIMSCARQNSRKRRFSPDKQNFMQWVFSREK